MKIIFAATDPKDSYLLVLSDIGNADYLVTGDIDLLEMEGYKNAKIITFTKLKSLLQ